MRRRALCASPGPSLIRQEKAFTHRAHSARPLRPEPELIPSRRGNALFFQSFSNGFPRRFQGQNWRPKSVPNRTQEPSETLLEPVLFGGGLPKPFGSPRNFENRAPATMRAQFRLKSPRAWGSKIEPEPVQNRSQKPPRRRPDGFKSRLQSCDFGAIFEPDFHDFPEPKGALSEVHKWHLKS